jgi:hypothetical protein
MADPRVAQNERRGAEYQRRMTYAADGSDIVYSATVANGSAVVGRAVMLSGNGIVRLTGAGTHVLGKLLQVEWDGRCTILVAGPTDLPKGDNAIAVGDKIVGDTLSAARGYIRGAAAPGAAYAEAAADDSANARHIVENVATATEIHVLLGGG